MAGGEERSAKEASCWKSCSRQTRAVKRRGGSDVKPSSLEQSSAIVRMMESTAAASSGGGEDGGGKAAIDVIGDGNAGKG